MSRRGMPRLFVRILPWVLLTGCAHMPWNQPPDNTETANAGPLPRDDDSAKPPPAPFDEEHKARISRVHPWVQHASQANELDPNLIHAVIWVESRHQPRAKSPAGARGLMQLMPATAAGLAKQMGEPRAKVYDPEFNVNAGSLYLAHMLERYEGDETLALAAYNAGPGNVDKWIADEGLPPRSLEYVELVMQARRRFEALNGEWSMPLDEDRTMIAAAEAPRSRPEPTRSEPRIPEPPPAAEPAPADRPAPNPFAPEPGVYKPEPTPEPPLADTPSPPLRRLTPATAKPTKDPGPRAPATVTDESLPPPPGLPSVLD